MGQVESKSGHGFEDPTPNLYLQFRVHVFTDRAVIRLLMFKPDPLYLNEISNLNNS